MFDRLLCEAQKLAEGEGASSIDIECYVKISGRVTFPATSSLWGSYNEPDIVESLLAHGFKKQCEKICFELDSKSIAPPFAANSCAPVSQDERKAILNRNSISCLVLPMTELQNEMGYSHSRQLCLLTKGCHSVSMAKEGKILGISYWFRDLYPLIKRNTMLTRASKPKKLQYGKIFKILIDKYDEDCCRALILKTVRDMSSYGINRIQIGNLNVGSALSKTVKSMGGQEKHKLWQMEKILS